MKRSVVVLPLSAILLFGMAIGYLVHREHKGEDGIFRVNPAFRPYIQAFTSGMVSSRSQILVRLTEPFADSAENGTPIPEEWYRIRPKVSGKAFWFDNRTFAFRPDEPLPQDQLFTFDFHLSKLVTVPDSLSTLTFQFRTIRQTIDVRSENHVALSPDDLTREVMTGLLNTSDVADPDAIERCLTARQEGRVLPLTWIHDAGSNEHRFRIDSVVRSKRPGNVNLEWDGSPIGSESRGSLGTEIPALGDFRVMEVSSFSGEQPGLLIRFSEPPDPLQNLEGLFRVARFSNLRFVLEDNLLKIWLASSELRTVRLSLEPSIRSVAGNTLGTAFSQEVTLEDTRPAVRFIGDGVIMPSSNGMLLPFEAVNLNKVDIRVVKIFEKNILQFLQVNDLPGNSELVRVGRIVLQKSILLGGAAGRDKWNRYSIDLSSLIKTEPGAIYNVILGFRQSYANTECRFLPENRDERSLVTLSDADAENERDWGWYSGYQEDDFADGRWRQYRWEERDDPCKSSYYFNKSVNRNVLASDLGIIAKAGQDDRWSIWVTDLLSARSLTGVTLRFYNFQLQEINTAVTGADGMAQINLTRQPFVVVARQGKQTGYLKLQEGKSLSLSMFDVGGETVQKGLKGFIYGERGIWRPGDSLFISFMLEDKTNQLPPHHPVTMTLTNPAGQIVRRMVSARGVNGLHVFRTATSPEAPTGNWMAKVNVGNAEFRKTIRIETVKPNRLKILIDFGTTRLIRDRIPAVSLQASWLTGAIARNLKAKINLTLSRSVTAFQKYPGYVFDNPAVGFAPENITIFDGQLDDRGMATVRPVIHVENVAPGALKASFETMVFEEGGDFSIDRFSIPFYPYATYAGLKLPDTGKGDRALNTGQQYTIGLLNIDADGNPVASSSLKVELFKLEWRWWWDDTGQGGADFLSLAYNRPVDTASVRVSGGKATYEMFVSRDDWGRYLIRVTDRVSGHSAGKVVYVDWPDYFRMPGGEKQAAAMLTIASNKASFKVGEKIRISIPSSPDGRALVTIESGTSVIRSFWSATRGGSTEIEFEATAQMVPNCYACVTLIQPHAQTKNDLPVRLYGVLPLMVEDPGTKLSPVLKLPASFSPGEEAVISVREQNGLPMTYTISVVDEGLLDLTRFATPDPRGSFYAREALGVKTWDLYDQVMGAFSGELQRILSIGGDQDVIGRDGQKPSRFRPMVVHLGPFALKKGENRTHLFRMPAYVGSVRVMAVAGQDGRYGSAEKSVPVKKALMVLGTLPRVLGPGETVALPVTVFAMEPKIRKVSVMVETDEHFTVNGMSRQHLNFSAIGEQLAFFSLKVAGETGRGNVRIVVTGDGERAEHLINIDIRNPNEPVYSVTEQVIHAGKVWNTMVSPPGIAGTNSGYVELSAIPSLNLTRRLDELIHYPYGCLEQIVSAAFPQLYLSSVVDLSESEKRSAAGNIASVISRIGSFQLPSGGFGLWPGAQYPDDWVSSYTGHFLLEASERGFSLPAGWFDRWLDFQRQKANSWNVNAGVFNDEMSQAYRLYTLALARSPESGAMNRLLEQKELSANARWRLAAAFALTGRQEVAQRLIRQSKAEVSPYRELGGTYGSDLRDKAMMLETMTILGMKSAAVPLAREVANALAGKEWLSTQTSAYAILALAKFAGNETGNGISALLSTSSEGRETISSERTLVKKEISIRDGGRQPLSITNTGKGILYARVVTRGIPASGDTTSAFNGLRVIVFYKDLQGNIISPIRLKQGTSFLAEVTVIHPGTAVGYQQLALSQIFPSGWEIINARSSDLALSKSGSYPINYQDVRDDRVNTFFDLPGGRRATITVMLMATWPGRYYQPPVRCSAMYDQTIMARVPGRWVEVVKE